jgi:hypothetical protein
MSGFERPSRASRATCRTRLALDLRAPGVDFLVVFQVVDQLVVHKQLAVVVAAIDTRDEAVDASPMSTGSSMTCLEMMMPDVHRGTRIAVRGALKRPEKARGASGVDLASGDAAYKISGLQVFRG